MLDDDEKKGYVLEMVEDAKAKLDMEVIFNLVHKVILMQSTYSIVIYLKHVDGGKEEIGSETG